jgi:hypothetical protein
MSAAAGTPLSTASDSSSIFVADSWRNVYAGELEVRPPGAPTTRTLCEHTLGRTDLARVTSASLAASFDLGCAIRQPAVLPPSRRSTPAAQSRR